MPDPTPDNRSPQSPQLPNPVNPPLVNAQPNGPTTSIPSISPVQIQPTLQAPPPRPSEGQVGVSASQMGLNSFGPRKNRTFSGLIKLALALIAVCLVVEGGLYVHNYYYGMSQKQVTFGGYTYSFTFYTYSSKVRLSDGSFAYKYRNKVMAGGEPTVDQTVSNCSQIGGSWRLAFTAQVGGNPVPVCTYNNANFEMLFASGGHDQIFIVTYNSIQSTSNYPQINAILSSVNVVPS